MGRNGFRASQKAVPDLNLTAGIKTPNRKLLLWYLFIRTVCKKLDLCKIFGGNNVPSLPMFKSYYFQAGIACIGCTVKQHLRLDVEIQVAITKVVARAHKLLLT